MRRVPLFLSTLSTAVVLLVAAAAAAPGRPDGPVSTQDQGTTREFSVVGENFGYRPPTIEVNRNDLVKITFTAVDIPHSFTIDEYRIAKRANAGQTVTFEFRADRPGRFAYYCNLAQDDRCKNMKGTLVVK